MKSYKFSELIEEITEYNTELKYGLNDIVGVTIEKALISTIANLTQTSLEKFYIVKPNTFVYNPRTHGVRLGMGYNQTERTYITTWNNFAFKVKDTMLDVLNPDYLWMYFNRSEWDRETNFKAWGSSTIVFSWNIFMDMSIKLPEKSIQDTLVKQYTIIKNRIELKKKINDTLEAQAQTLFTLKVQNACEMRSLGSFGTVVTGKTPSTDVSEFYGNDVPFVKTPDMHGNTFITSSENSLSTLGAESQANKYLPKNTVIVACIGANAGEVAITSFRSQTNQQINAIISEYPCFLYLSIKAHTTELRALGEGSSTMININKTSFENYEIPTLKDDDILLLEKQLSRIFAPVLSNLREIDKLNETKDILVSRISC